MKQSKTPKAVKPVGRIVSQGNRLVILATREAIGAMKYKAQ